jgi:hypothetical protein
MAMFMIVYGIGAGLEFLGHRDAWGRQLIQFAIFVVVVGCLARARGSAGFRNYVFARIAGVALSLAGMASVAVIALGVTLLVAFIEFDLNLVWVLLVAVLAWPYAALAYLTEDPAPTVGRLVFPYPWAIEPTWREIISDT